MTKPLDIAHISFSEKQSDLPEFGKPTPCCSTPKLEEGFGLAGGGYGVYQYCDNCGKIVSKTEAPK